MLLIKCPWCGERAETEFSYGGERIWGATAAMIVELREIVLKQ